MVGAGRAAKVGTDKDVLRDLKEWGECLVLHSTPVMTYAEHVRHHSLNQSAVFNKISVYSVSISHDSGPQNLSLLHVILTVLLCQLPVLT